MTQTQMCIKPQSLSEQKMNFSFYVESNDGLCLTWNVSM